MPSCCHFVILEKNPHFRLLFMQSHVRHTTRVLNPILFYVKGEGVVFLLFPCLPDAKKLISFHRRNAGGAAGWLVKRPEAAIPTDELVNERSSSSSASPCVLPEDGVCSVRLPTHGLHFV